MALQGNIPPAAAATACVSHCGHENKAVHFVSQFTPAFIVNLADKCVCFVLFFLSSFLSILFFYQGCLPPVSSWIH